MKKNKKHCVSYLISARPHLSHESVRLSLGTNILQLIEVLVSATFVKTQCNEDNHLRNSPPKKARIPLNG